ncbi:MAG TPA: hypothetical protein VGU43_01200 [Thermoplasmata archaeon]|nr:hypothetical protein [Thermoplasmata archaeon]
MTRPVRRWLLRFGYDGSRFAGWARQPGLRTVEGEIVAGIRRRRIAELSGRPGLEVASRTDRGVSARANALVLRSSLPPSSLLQALNGIAPDILFREAREVTDVFRVRGAIAREYHYLEPGPAATAARWAELVPLFEGRPVDVRSFGRGLPLGAPVWRDIERLSVVEETGYFRLELRARSFVWGMVRKIVAALRAATAGEISPERLAAAIAGKVRLTLPLAEPERLVLWEVEYPERGGLPAPRLAWRQRAYFDSEGICAALRPAVLAAVLDGGPQPAAASLRTGRRARPD